MKRRLFALFAVCLLCVLCAACQGRDAQDQDDGRYDYLNAALDFHAQLGGGGILSGFSDEEIAQAGEELVAAGHISQEELDGLCASDAATRAQFIWLVTAALDPQLPAADNALPQAAWYAPYVQAGYDLAIFPGGGLELSFLPAGGFRLGEEGYAPMEAPMTREDAQKILEHMFPGQTLLPTLDPEDYFGYHEEILSQGDALVCAWQVSQGDYTPAPAEDRIPTAKDLVAQGRVIHAGGYVANAEGKESSYTNSVEALVNAYQQGGRLIEIDFTETSDGHLACIHDWITDFAPEITQGEALPLDQWMDVRIYRSFSPMCLESLADFMRQHPDLYIVTDVKSNNVGAAGIIAKTCPDLLDRFVIQIYRDGQYDAISQLGFSNMIYTFYNLSNEQRLDTDHMAQFAKDHPLVAFTYGNTMLEEEGYTEAMLRAGVPLCVHTLNDPAEIQRAYDMGITAVYTDNVK